MSQEPIRVTKVLVHAEFLCACGALYERLTTAPYVDGQVGPPNPLPTDGECNECFRKMREAEKAAAAAQSRRRAFAKKNDQIRLTRP